MATCYRHPGRETGVSCSNCGNPICTDCMTATPVGMRCPDCAKQKTQVRRVGSIHGSEPTVSYVIIAICAMAWVAQLASDGSLTDRFSLFGPSIALDGEYWRLVTSGFLHSDSMPYGLLHIGFNMYILYFLGSMLEPSIGRARFVALYVASLLGGALGALLLSDIQAATVGASGAVFGLMGATYMMERARGVDFMQSSVGPLILLNLLLSFAPGVSIGGHLGGLVAGIAGGVLIDRYRGRRNAVTVTVAILSAFAVLAVAGAAYTADSKTEARFPGISLVE